MNPIGRLSLVLFVALSLSACGSGKKRVGEVCQGSDECASGLTCTNSVCTTVANASDTTTPESDSEGSDGSGSSTDTGNTTADTGNTTTEGNKCTDWSTGHPDIDSLGLQANTLIEALFNTLCQCTASNTPEITYEKCLALVNFERSCFVPKGQEACAKEVVDLGPDETRAFLQCTIDLYSTAKQCMDNKVCTAEDPYTSCFADEAAFAACEAKWTDAQRKKIAECNGN